MKALGYIKSTKFIFFITALIFSAQVGVVAAQTSDYFQNLEFPFYDPNNTDLSCSASSVTDSSAGTGNLDLQTIANKYNLQSAQVMKLGANVVASFQADQPPSTPASTMKLIIVDTVLRSGISLTKTIDIPSSIEYAQGSYHEHIGTTITIGDAIDLTLRRSGNTSANVLMYSFGGVGAFTKQAQSYGYTHTNVVGIYTAANDGKNSSTISDEVAAMNHLFTTSGSGYIQAQKDLEFAAGPYDQGVKTGDNYYGVTDDANKWAGTSTVAGNVGKFSISGSNYIIGVYTNQSDSSPGGISAVKDGSEAIAAALSASNPTSSTSTPAQPTTVLNGSDHEQQVWNYFKDKGLSDAQVAGIMGNIQQESNFSPTIMQNGGNSNNPYDAGDKGWGLIQWSGNGTTGHSTGDKFTEDYNASGVSGPVYALSTQLDLVWQHLNNNPVVTQPFDLSHFKQITSETEAANYFLSQIEAGTDPGGVRESNATSILQKHGGTGGGSYTDGCGVSISPDCQSAQGSAKILCSAKVYDSASYSETVEGGHQGGAAWHATCPVVGPSCILDCSGLVNIAVYDAFGADLKENTFMEVSDTQYWKITSADQIQPGDLIQPNSGHVEIIDHVAGDTIFTFGSHDPNRPQADQISPSSFSKTDSNVYLHYIGQGASS